VPLYRALPDFYFSGVWTLLLLQFFLFSPLPSFLCALETLPPPRCCCFVRLKLVPSFSGFPLFWAIFQFRRVLSAHFSSSLRTGPLLTPPFHTGTELPFLSLFLQARPLFFRDGPALDYPSQSPHAVPGLSRFCKIPTLPSSEFALTFFSSFLFSSSFLLAGSTLLSCRAKLTHFC